MVLEKTLESPLDCKEIKSIIPKGNQPWIFIGRTAPDVEAPVLWPPDVESQMVGKDLDARKDWGQQEGTGVRLKLINLGELRSSSCLKHNSRNNGFPLKKKKICILSITVHVVVQFLNYVWLYNPKDCSMPGSFILHCLLEFAQIHVHWVSDAI